MWLQYKTEKDGVIETRIEKKVVAGDSQHIDHDKVTRATIHHQQTFHRHTRSLELYTTRLHV